MPHLLFCSLWKSYEFLWQLFAKAIITGIWNWISSYRVEHHIIPKGSWPNHIWFLVSLAFFKIALSLQFAESVISMGRRQPVPSSPHRPLIIALLVAAGGARGSQQALTATCSRAAPPRQLWNPGGGLRGTPARGPEDRLHRSFPTLHLACSGAVQFWGWRALSNHAGHWRCDSDLWHFEQCMQPPWVCSVFETFNSVHLLKGFLHWSSFIL